MTEATWHSVAAKDDVAPDEPIKVEVGDTEIALFNVDGEISATSNICTHAFASMVHLSLIHISEPTRRNQSSRMPSSA